MRFTDYVRKHGPETVARVAASSGVSEVTLRNVLRGMLISKYDVARRVSDATGGAVSVKELCERKER